MVKGKSGDPIEGVLGRFVIALMKGTGLRLSAAQVKALAPLFLETIRGIKSLPSRPPTAKKPQRTTRAQTAGKSKR